MIKLIDNLCGLLTAYWLAIFVVGVSVGFMSQFHVPTPGHRFSLIAVGAVGILYFLREREENWRWWARLGIVLVHFGVLSLSRGIFS